MSTSLDTVFAPASERVSADAPDGTLKAELRSDFDVDASGTVGAWELHGAAKYRLESEARIHLLQSNVEALVVDEGRAHGVATWEGVPRSARCVALCVGSFLGARLHVGRSEERAGRPGEMAYDELADDLERRGIDTVPARIEGGGDGRPAWTVLFRRLADGAVADHAVLGLPGLYAAGACRVGPLDYARAAEEGRTLAERIDADLGPSGQASEADS